MQFQSHRMNSSRKAVASRANAGQMLEAQGLGHIIDKVHRDSGHGSSGGGGGAGGGAGGRLRGQAAGSGAGNQDRDRAAAVKAAMVHAWRG